MSTRIVSRLRGQLSYANVTASLALFIALGGTGYAALQLPRNSVGNQELRAGAVRSSEIRNRAIQTRDISKRARTALRGAQGPAGPAGITEHALVGSTGAVVAGTAQETGWSAATPEYHRLQFGRDVSRCAYTATLAAVPSGNVQDPAPGRVTVAPAPGMPTDVVVKTYDAAGNPAEQPFHLIVVC